MNTEDIRKLVLLPHLRKPGELAPLIKLLPGQAQVVELGAFAGESSRQFLDSPKIAKLICVDLWKRGYSPGDWASDADMDAAQIAFAIRLAAEIKSGRCVPAVMSTLAAADGLSDGPFADMVYLDADHAYEAVVADLRAWLPRIKAGGLIAGHDFYCPAHPGVTRAVLQVLGQPDHLFPDSSWAKRV